MGAVLEEHVFSTWERVPKIVKKIEVWTKCKVENTEESNKMFLL